MVETTVSHYRLSREHLRWRHGVVYKAEDTVHGHLVAIKFLPVDSVSDETVRERF